MEYNELDEAGFAAFQENIRRGCQRTVTAKNRVSMIVFVRYCAINAHTPYPCSAIAMPTTADTKVPMIVEKKKRLKSIRLEMYAVCMD